MNEMPFNDESIKKDENLSGGTSNFIRGDTEATIAVTAAGHAPGLLELVYGVLFEPGKTMRKVAEKPPLGLVTLVVALLSVFGSLTGVLIFSRVLNFNLAPREHLLSIMVLMLLTGAVLWGFLKWFIYSALLHLAAALLGGRGDARGVLAAVGLSGMPMVFLIPVQFLSYWLGARNTALSLLVVLAGLAVAIWSVVVLVIGLKQVHGLPAGRCVFIVFSPVAIFLAAAVLIAVVLAALVASMPARMNLPGYF